MSRGARVGVAVAVLVGLLAVAVLSLFEWREKEVETRFSLEAYINPWLAARRTLRRMGVDANSARSLSPEGLAALEGERILVLGVELSELPAIGGQFEPWVAAGGDLVLVLDSDESPEIEESEALDAAAFDESEEAETWLGAWSRLGYGLFIYGEERGDEGEFEMRIPLREGSRLPATIPVSTTSSHALSTEPPWHQYGHCYAQRRYQRGSLTVFCADDPLANKQIHDKGHPDLLWFLALGEQGAAVASPRIWLVSSLQAPSFGEWIWARAPYAVIGAAAFLVAVLLMAARRFGPIRNEESAQRRSVVEHIMASSRFVWRQGGIDSLLVPMVDDTERRVLRQLPNFQELSDDRQLEVLTRLVGDEAPRLAAVLRREPIEARSEGFGGAVGEIVRTVRALERVRRTL